MNKKLLIISVCVLVILILGIGIYWYYTKNNGQLSVNNNVVKNHDACLSDDEVADYKINEKRGYLADIIISIKDKDTKKELLSFKINDVFENYHPVEVYKCGVYAIKFFNYNPQKTKQDSGFKAELWQYQYDDKGNNLLILAEKTESGLLKGDFSYDFRVDPNEKYLVLEKGYLGQDDYSLVIKDLKTRKDLFTLKFNDVIKEHPKMLGTFGLVEWTGDGRYFWAEIFDEAYPKGYIRIDTQNWSYQIFELPNDMDVGVSGPINFNTGYTFLYPGLVWTGSIETDNQIKEEWKKEGKQSKMYLYNIFIKEKILLAMTTEPLWDFNAKWLSDTQFQYEMPNGEKKVYEIK